MDQGLRINTAFLFKSTQINAGSSGLSDPIDLRDISRQGQFSLSYTVGKVGTASTSGTTTFSYLGCAVFDGTYIAPANSTFGTQSGTAGGSDIISFSPPVMPFMKIQVNAGTSCSAAITAALHIR